MTRPRQCRFVRFSLAAAVLTVAVGMSAGRPLLAEDESRGSAYARVRFLSGGVTIESTARGETVEASINSPLVPGDRLRTDAGRAEIQLADSTIVRLDEDTVLTLRSLADSDNELEKTDFVALEQGTIRIEIREPLPTDGGFQIDAEAGSVYLLSPGSFRVDSDSGVTTVSSFRGVAELSGDSGSVLVRSGERSSVRAGRASSEPRHFNTIRQDDFDEFCQERDQLYLSRAPRGETIDDLDRDLPPEIHPYVGELSAYGAWHTVPEYGRVWRPTYYGPWGPYVNGHWTWCPTGWAWVSDDVWGWAPYHYGRWDFAVDLGWIWIPGRTWSGAWVSFAVGPAYVGWCPLNFYNRPVFLNVDLVRVRTINVGRLDPRGWRFVPVGRFGERGLGKAMVRGDGLPRGTDLVVARGLPRFNPRDVAARPERGREFVEKVRATRPPVPVGAGASPRMVPFRELERRSPRGTRPAPPPGERPRSLLRPEGRGPGAPGRIPGESGNVLRAPAGPGIASPDIPRTRPAPSRAPRPLPRAEAGSPRRGVATPPSVDPPGDRGPADGGSRPRRPDARDRGRAAARPDPPTPEPPRADRPRGHAVERLFEGARRPAPPPSAARPPARSSPPPSSRGGESKGRRDSKPSEKPRRGDKDR